MDDFTLYATSLLKKNNSDETINKLICESKMNDTEYDLLYATLNFPKYFDMVLKIQSDDLDKDDWNLLLEDDNTNNEIIKRYCLKGTMWNMLQLIYTSTMDNRTKYKLIEKILKNKGNITSFTNLMADNNEIELLKLCCKYEKKPEDVSFYKI